MSGFLERLQAVSRTAGSLVCVGLDPDRELMAVPDVAEFNAAIVDATKDVVCAYKLNLAFYEVLGIDGLHALQATVAHIRNVAPHVQILADAKRGDIDSTNAKHAEALFEVWGFDAATVNAYAGGESLQPLLEYTDKGVFVWCRSSNRGAEELQDLRLSDHGETATLYEWMATRAVQWNTRGNVGLVVGATYPKELERVRALSPGMPILIPGVGAQSGELEGSVRAGLDADVPNILISSSRGIAYASRDKKDFAEAARRAAQHLRDRINRILLEEGRRWC